ncbi:cytosolic endo-beta-N-acetylglucosaminidase 1 [Selaginella moellendorffii]|uniref:cytosolic endo-beta-N-acetylglucosaminidase 1 n=1 Tax=Selaginella moellendorffii TaxID=88036 RepID=UPI000D1C7A27|nr:cytosolic endo-beta-N-acetylglucosaminidase 1 [Selaginella moellendorffii]|eukprot:XP_024526195.1 cytosolic endo-beta-N-acetylglucosaminidase 1 [Selaginella moellendorffii]
MFLQWKRLWKALVRKLRRKLGIDRARVAAASLVAAMDLKQPALPISFPLTSLDQLRDDSVFQSFHFPFQQCSVPLALQGGKKERKSKLLVCHDMKGGYQDDRFVQGDGNYNAYSLWHWQCIDVFVYFSHSLITIPPPCWINAGHRHGVQVLGTFITEWDQGAQTCKLLLESKDSARMYASRLAKVAREFGFDGWLLNIENTVPVEQIDTLVVFVSELTKVMHDLVPGSLVIWYDAVTVDGELQWQDMLTEKNKRFFDACDGIFINYTWKRDYAAKSAKVAGDRASDVYMGVDVFGRNTFGGGGFQSNVALKVALEAGVSAALFGPGWVYEKNIGPTFEDAQIRFWASIHNAWPVSHRYPVTLPFFSDFSQGFGKAVYVDGDQVSDSPWSNISCQALQPLLLGALDPEFEVTVRSVDRVYSGGSSLRFLGKLKASDVRITKLYDPHLVLANPTLSIDFSVMSKENAIFYLVLKLQGPGGIRVVFLSNEHSGTSEKKTNQSSSSFSAFEPHRTVTKSSGTSDDAWNVSEYQIEVEQSSVVTNIYGMSTTRNAPLDFEEITGTLAAESSSDTQTSFRLTSSSLTRKFLPDATQPYELHLGHLRITAEPPAPPTVSSFRADDLKWSTSPDGNKLVSLTLKWEFGGGFQADRCNTYVEMVGKETTSKAKYLGAAFVDAFYVDSLLVPHETSSLVFRLQPRNAAGFHQGWNEALTLTVEVL